MKIVQKLLVLTVVLMSMLNIACEKENVEKKCDVSNPVDELPWLNSLVISFSEYDYIMTANYNGQTVFIYGNCNPVVNYVPAVYNCNGDVITDANDIQDELSDSEVIWTHENSECVFID